MSFKRASGVLLHPTSLPSAFGIGDLGQAAYDFVDFLKRSGQSLWQVLPLGPTGYDHSPYTMNFSAFAGNPLMISLERLVEEGLLETNELEPLPNSNPNRVEFSRVIPHKRQFLGKAFERFQASLTGDNQAQFDQFCQEQAWWLDDFVLFMALLEANDGKPWSQWEEAVARRQPEALQAKTEALHEQIQFHRFLQFKFFEQWSRLRAYTNGKGIQIVGDVSIYVCHNSSDVWAHPKLFKLNPETLESAYIAGVPPDYFSETGQLWGNPVYDWDECQRTEFDWWTQRFKATLQYVDVVRVDHFRGFEAYWQVPAGEATAINGEWVKAPGEAFFKTLGERLGSLPIMAEDLGIITPEVEALRDQFDFPGMKILMFGFNGNPEDTHLPHHYARNSVVYSGTHDNDTTLGWWATLRPEEKQFFAQYLGYASPDAVSEINWVLIRLALSTVSDLAIIPLQDLLGLEGWARMNDPSKIPGNWRWRYGSSDLLTQEISDRIRELTRIYSR
ncbi:4-alpha-glucanotransferase [Pseudanabaena sp. FACHB-2040]|uniref:4-alpha-glucanotransferase n=1 Tax=Pseudanabaena sp. FACHB-2040 TaxID=2692859 RepID=UPI00168871DA|nr:4-alpha-glucanotransferase [Pseudanabaena sp. FACHB-2040]MBD2260458.1 4-alpha-glucanotransferase [Pseudanabaena sp. FACHB-2040]